MKVCTDACLFGALAPLENATRILDIGTGTGLLALMAAQRSEAKIEAVEIDAAAAQQARQNAAESPWHHRILLTETALQNYRPQKPFDLIISNPPFFVASLKSEAENEQVAKHSALLSFAEIVAFAAANLTPGGQLCILLPAYEQQLFADAAAQANLFAAQQVLVRNQPQGRVIRAIVTYAFGSQKLVTEELNIRAADGQYSDRFRELLKDFYLAF